MVAADEIELIVTPLRQPATNQMLIEPRAPAPLRRHPRIDQQDVEQYAYCQQREVGKRKQQDRLRVPFLERVEHPAVPHVHPVCRREIEKTDKQKKSTQVPRQSISAVAPEPYGTLPKSAQQVSPLHARGILPGIRSGSRRFVGCGG